MGERAAMTHIVGLDVMVGPVRRQRCGWCGVLLDQLDLTRVAWPLNPDGSDPGPPPPWPVGALMRTDGAFSSVVDHADGDQLPDDACARLPEGTP